MVKSKDTPAFFRKKTGSRSFFDRLPCVAKYEVKDTCSLSNHINERLDIWGEQLGLKRRYYKTSKAEITYWQKKSYYHIKI